MQEPSKILYRITSLADRSAKLHHVLTRPSREQTVRIDIWYLWAQGYLPGDVNLEQWTKFVECDTNLGYTVESEVSSNYTWEGEHWNEKAQHRIQKDLNKGGINRIIQQQSSWHHIESRLWINAPFRVDIVDALNPLILIKSDIPYKGQIRT